MCHDTRGTVYNENLANCKSIEKTEIEKAFGDSWVDPAGKMHANSEKKFRQIFVLELNW